MMHAMPPSNDSGFHELGKLNFKRPFLKFRPSYAFFFCVVLESGLSPNNNNNAEPAVDEYVSDLNLLLHLSIFKMALITIENG